MLTIERKTRIVHSKFLGSLLSFSSVLTLALLLVSSGCGLVDIPAPNAMECKIRTYIETSVGDYVSDRYGKTLPVRVAVIPFDVPESFAPPGNESLHYGRVLAEKFQQALLQSQAFPIVELFNRDRWPGKRDEFFTGNHQAISLAKAAGYDLVVVGSLADIVNDRDLVLQTKIIDVNTSITLWFGETTATSDSRMLSQHMGSVGMLKHRPDCFYFKERADELASCTIARVILEIRDETLD